MFLWINKNRITLYYEKGTACQSTFSAVIDAVAIDVISTPLAGQKSVVCRGSNFEVNIQNKQVNRSLTYDWQTNGNLVSGQGSSLATFKMDAPTLITLNLSNALGCKSTLIFPVDIHASIQSNINTGVQLCRDVATVTN